MKTVTKLLTILVLNFSFSVHAQYCMLPGRVPYSADQPGIKVFKLNTINRVSSNVENMSSVVVLTNDTTVLLRGHTYTVTMYHNRDSVVFPTTRNNIRVWIDYNGNTSFDDAGETVISADFQTVGFYTNTFTVPLTAPIGTTRLRATAKMSSDAGHTIPTSCDVPADPIGYHGEMEDYIVKIMAPTAVQETNMPANNVIVYPNPTANQLTVSFEEVGKEAVSVDLLDITGKLVGHLLSNTVQSATTYTFDLNDLTSSPGIYFVKVSAGIETSYHKVVKTK